MARLRMLLVACIMASACTPAADDVNALPTPSPEPPASASPSPDASPRAVPAPTAPPPLPAGGVTIDPPDLSNRSVDCTLVDDPCHYGDDPDLDALWDACADGFGGACDRLYYDSPFDTRYEQFGNTCGDRGLRFPCPERLA